MPFVQLVGRGTSVAYKVVLVVELLSHVLLFVTPWTIAHQVPLSMGFSRLESWSALPPPSPEGLPTQGLNPCLLHWQAGSLPLSHRGSPACKVAPYKLSIVSIILKPGVQLVAEQSLFTDWRSFLPPPSQQPQLPVPSV